MASYNSAIDNIYNYYLTQYAPKNNVSKYDAHKKSELRGVYNSMLKLNKDTPLYILDSSNASREFAIDLKENARELRNTIASLGGIENDNMFNKKSAYSTDDDMVSAEYIGEPGESDNAISFDIEVTSLASPQVNLGYALPSSEITSLAPGEYSFDLSINDLSYEFQFNVRSDDTNKDIEERLSRLINNAGVGIKADILENGKGSSSLRLTSEAEGLKPGKEEIFNISDEHTSKTSGAVEYLGIDYVAKAPSNAEFYLNGEPRSTSSNHFTIDKQYELTLNGVSREEGHMAHIGVKADTDSISENVGRLVDGYNNFINAANKYRNAQHSSTKLLSEMQRISSYYQDNLQRIGFDFSEDGSLNMDDQAFKSSLNQDPEYSQLSIIKDFASSILRKTNQISLNPMEYIDKTVVAYKNPGHNFTAPYVSSNYSGMLFNSYC
ncbi:MAG: flagellar capping protein [Lachnospiraceae bacterium]|nr:flagellar capping protein [Lachnospiraceae bacterium]